MTISLIERLYEKCRQPSRFLVLLLFLLNVVLVFPVLFPNLSDIGLWDESGYINSGRLLVEKGVLQEPAWNPLGALFYAITYMPVQNTEFWLIHSCTIGRFILFGLMWLSAYLVTRQLTNVLNPFIMIALLLISPSLTYLLPNPSDAQFTAMSALALWQVLLFYNRKKMQHVWLASLFIGLAALSRNDGLILFSIFIVLTIILSIPIKQIGTAFIAAIVPFIIFTGGYVGLYGLKTGNFKTGVVERTYVAFEQGQGFAYEYPVSDGTLDTRRIFGSPEQNRYSIISAIKHNPKAFLDRVRQTVRTSPKKIYFMYGERSGIIILLLAFMGAVEIARKRLYLLLLILLLWPVHILVYLITFYRHTYFLLPYFVIFSFATVSLSSILCHMNKKRLYFWTILLLALALLGIMTNRPNVFSAALIFLIGLWVIKIIVNRYQDHEAIKPIAITLALSLLFFLKAGYPLPRFRTLGIAPDEKAVLFMQEHLSAGSLILADAPGTIWTARMDFYPLDFRLRNVSEKDLSDGITKYTKAVYVNNALRYFEPGLAEKIAKLIGKGLEVGFRSEKGEVEVLLVR